MMMKKKKTETFERLHSRPVSRRDFLSTGLISFSTTMFLPSMVNIFARSGVAEAQDLVCKAVGSGSSCAFVGIKLSGGAAMSANFVPHDSGLQPLASYTKMGLGLGSRLALDYEFSNKAPFYANSGLLRGVRTASQNTTRLATTFVGVPVRAMDDSAMNKFDITGLVAKSGLNGKILPNLGTVDSSTGVRALPAYLSPPAPLIAASYQDIVGSLGVSGSLSTLSTDQKAKLFTSVQKMSADQSSKIQGMSGGAMLTQLMRCAHIDNTNLIANSGALNIDPISNTAFATIWGLTAATNKASQDYVFATLVYNSLNGNAGSINLEMGGYDYHNGTRTSGDGKDNDAGVLIGRVLESMALMGKKGFIVVTSDGSVTSGSESQDAGAAWTSDRGANCSAYMIGYDPAGAKAVKAFQLGQFTKDQVADDTFITGANPEAAGGGIFANYLAFNGQISAIDNYLPRVFTPTDLDTITMFTK